ncbi:alpha/beta fold hydrolase [Micromonospora sp. NPDC000668]|uniref:alpha/beta fold hydrolase n=1 Tax=Micromonospora sp. NPDC000668 TaxID=3364219 RepID=UPI0036C4276E
MRRRPSPPSNASGRASPPPPTGRRSHRSPTAGGTPTAGARVAGEAGQRNDDAAAVYYSVGAVDPEAVRSALGHLQAPVLLLAGEYDVGLPPKRAAEYAGLFPRAELAVQPGAGHYPWLDDPEWFVETMAGFLR